MIKVYRRTDTIKAEQFDGSDAMVKKYHISVYNENIDKYGGLGKSTPNEYIFNGIYIDIDDWIVTGVSGGHWTIADDLFNKTYAELPVIPKAVGDDITYAKANGMSIGDVLWRCGEGGMFDCDEVESWINDHGDTFAQAWVLGAWRVEETGEIVKLEASK